MSSEDSLIMLLGMLIVGGPYAILIVGRLSMNTAEKRYMAEQRSTGRDKQRMLDFMQIVMKEYYGEYTYVAGGDIISTGRFSANYYPYIVGFNEKDLVIISYTARNGALICRNVLPVDWGCMRLKYRVFSKGVKLIVILGKTKLRIKISRVAMSDGSEKFDTPLGIFQENEVDKLIRSLLRIQQKTQTGVL
ncbi:MAG: hypothetical protein K2L86_03295 [Lachnospiraceae bacterium]|nr:hypothetical protein [Lachnospiraceae bacterium]